ncbi:helix-turn-helix domain-containing protein [Blastococcus saxobsidens]|uniref:Transcriptional regulator, XRE family n=1 Tax=Blastococcus saxobsidens (strain DD2) TaxID=1146883 RepID=H6RP01_BLASD|nr:helix-turn-helix transcriptional regulator [Blastococcus saxobsidens]CCG01463.1 Transcriptional regulator, XRE family [Blastococcus saxobsidens DD2]
MPDASSAPSFDLSGLLRRIRRRADLSQRELATELHVSKSTVAAVEAGTTGMDARLLAVAAGLAGLRLGLLDVEGREVCGMTGDAAGRRFPAHLDTVLSDERSSRWVDRRDRPRPIYTFDRRSPWDPPGARTENRPDDHLRPQPGDSPEERARSRRLAALARRAGEAAQRWAAELERRRAAGEPLSQDPFTCTCLPSCDELDDFSRRPVHADGCPCSCDLG